MICQHGSGENEFPVYRGVSRQYGYGLGSMFKTAMRTVIPILKPIAKAGLQSIKKVAQDQGVDALRDIMEGQNIKQVLKKRGKSALKSLGNSALDHLTIKSNLRPKKSQSLTKRRSGHIKNQKGKGRRKKSVKKNKYPKIRFEKDIFS